MNYDGKIGLKPGPRVIKKSGAHRARAQIQSFSACYASEVGIDNLNKKVV